MLVNTRFYLHSLVGVQFAENKGLRAVVLDHGSAYLTLGSELLDWVIERYEDGITAWLKPRDVDFYGISKKSVEWLGHFGIEAKGVISNALDAEAYRAQTSGRRFRKELGIDRPVLLVSFVGRLVVEKGIRPLLEAMGSLQSEGIYLAVAGEGPLKDEIEACGLPNVHMLGRLDSPDVAALLADSDVLCLPTRSEGFATTLLEAAACGTPCLISNGGAKELIPSSGYGFVEDDVTPDVIALILMSCAKGTVDLETMGRLSQLRVEKYYSWGYSARLVLEALTDV